MARPGRKPLAPTWRQQGAPGVNAPVPPGGKGVLATPGVLGRAKLTRALRKLDNTRDVAALMPYGEAAEEWLDAAAAQLAATYGDCGPGELAILRAAAQQLFWAEVLFDRARLTLATTEDGRDPKLNGAEAHKLAESATRIADSCRGNIVAAHRLRAERAAAESGNGAPRNPLAAFDVPPAADPSSET